MHTEAYQGPLASDSSEVDRPEQQHDTEHRPVHRHSGLPAIAAAAALLVLAAWTAASLPVPIPDTHTGTGASAVGEVNDWTSVGHAFRMDRDGLHRIDVALTTVKASSEIQLQFYVREEPRGPNLRTLRVSLDKIPEGKALDRYSTRWQDLPWVSFEFEPLYGYAGKQLYFNIEGKDIPKANTVQALFAYPNGYQRGEAHTAEKPAGANMVFRTYALGTIPNLLGATFPMLADGKPGFLGAEWVYRLAGAAALGSATLLVVSLTRFGRL